jgi:2-polyprenyl-3-methyl-5-hydroxy-6-metoxy-1,4-benzoquinol methylase
MKNKSSSDIWNQEYRDRKLISQQKARVDVRDFLRFLRRDEKLDLSELKLLDCGCGNGINTLYCIEQGVYAIGIDNSTEALELANSRKKITP